MPNTGILQALFGGKSSRDDASHEPPSACVQRLRDALLELTRVDADAPARSEEHAGAACASVELLRALIFGGSGAAAHAADHEHDHHAQPPASGAMPSRRSFTGLASVLAPSPRDGAGGGAGGDFGSGGGGGGIGLGG